MLIRIYFDSIYTQILTVYIHKPNTKHRIHRWPKYVNERCHTALTRFLIFIAVRTCYR